MIMAGNEIIGPIRRQNFRSFRFFTADTQACLGWNAMKNDPRFRGLSANRVVRENPLERPFRAHVLQKMFTISAVLRKSCNKDDKR